MAITKERAIDILDRFDMFQGQRAGRELWNNKPLDVQNQDIADFSRDVALLKEYINQADVVPRSEVEEIIVNIADLIWQGEDEKLNIPMGGRYFSKKDFIAEIKKQIGDN